MDRRAGQYQVAAQAVEVRLRHDDTDDFPTFKPRARQNVILELGYFVGKLGRPRVCVLHEEGVEIPSDFHGVVYVPLDPGETWKLRLAREMRAAGLKIDMNLL